MKFVAVGIRVVAVLEAAVLLAGAGSMKMDGVGWIGPAIIAAFGVGLLIAAALRPLVWLASALTGVHLGAALMFVTLGLGLAAEYGAAAIPVLSVIVICAYLVFVPAVAWWATGVPMGVAAISLAQWAEGRTARDHTSPSLAGLGLAVLALVLLVALPGIWKAIMLVAVGALLGLAWLASRWHGVGRHFALAVFLVVAGYNVMEMGLRIAFRWPFPERLAALQDLPFAVAVLAAAAGTLAMWAALVESLGAAAQVLSHLRGWSER